MYSDNDNIDEIDRLHTHYRRYIARLEDELWKTTGRIAEVLIDEGDQYGSWTRVAQILSVKATPQGLVIRVA